MLTKSLMDSIKKKVLYLKGDKSYETFAAEIKAKTGQNIHFTSIQKIATGERVPSLEMLSILAEYGGIDFKDFFEGINLSSQSVSTMSNISNDIKRKSLLKSINNEINEIDSKIKEEEGKVAKINNRLYRIPVLGFVPAGGPVITEENIEDYLELPLEMLKDECDFCLKVRGDSMIDVGINDGDTILVHPQPVAENGQTVIARIEGGVTCFC